MMKKGLTVMKSKIHLYTVLALATLPLTGCGAAEKLGGEVQNTLQKTDAAMKEGEQTLANYNEPQKAYAEANSKMHAGMGNIPADADEAFMAGMIPHHQGAVDMAKVALKYGKDPEVRKLAQQVIAAQEVEIKQMQAWLAKRGVKPEATSGEVDHSKMDHSKMGH
jgi:uncharacterized protein (DUF305 family)